MTLAILTAFLSLAPHHTMAPREGDTITMRYAPTQHSVKARNKWARPNPDLGTVPATEVKFDRSSQRRGAITSQVDALVWHAAYQGDSGADADCGTW